MAPVGRYVDQESIARKQRGGHALVVDFDTKTPEPLPPAPTRSPPARWLGGRRVRHPYPILRARGDMSATTWSTGFVNRLLDAVVAPRAVYAHCDIPCGIYDPHEAQIAALTVLRMDQLIAELPAPAMDAKPEDRAAFISKLARYTAVKELHSEKVKSEIRVIWGDYFTPDHVKQFPQAHETVWKIMKQASKARQGTALADAQELVKLVQDFAEMFWKTKGAKTVKAPSMQKSGGEIVYPTA
jgi:nickel superoxide dismutase